MPNGRIHAFLWQSGRGLQDLGALEGGFSSACGINNVGQVVGQATVTKDGHNHAFLWQAGKGMQDLGAIGGESNQANGINNAGQVVGGPDSYKSSHPAFLYSDGKMTDLNTMIDPASGWHLTAAKAINDSGQIVGTGKNKVGQLHAFLLTPNPSPQSPAKSPASQSPTESLAQKPVPPPPIRRPLRYNVTDLGTLGGETSGANAINNKGQVVGRADTRDGGYRAFLWQVGSGMQDIDLGSGARGSMAVAINNAGQVVGQLYPAGPVRMPSCGRITMVCVTCMTSYRRQQS